VAAFEALVLLKRERVHRIAYQVLRNTEDARDVAQQVFVRLWRVLGKYRTDWRFDTWLYRITVNLAIDYRRRQPAHGREVPLDVVTVSPSRGGSGRSTNRQHGGEPAAPPALSSGTTPLEALDRAELRRIYEAAAEELTERQRLIFTMREVDGLPAGEIARALGVTASTVRNTLFQSRAILREALRRRFPDYFAGGPETNRRGPGGSTDGDE